MKIINHLNTINQRKQNLKKPQKDENDQKIDKYRAINTKRALESIPLESLIGREVPFEFVILFISESNAFSRLLLHIVPFPDDCLLLVYGFLFDVDKLEDKIVFRCVDLSLDMKGSCFVASKCGDVVESAASVICIWLL